MRLELGVTWRVATITLLAVWLGLGAAGVPAAAQARNTNQHRYLTEQKNRTDIPAHYAPLTFAEFLALPAVAEKYTAQDLEIVRIQTQRGSVWRAILPRCSAQRTGRPTDGRRNKGISMFICGRSSRHSVVLPAHGTSRS